MPTSTTEPDQSLLSLYGHPGPYVSAFVMRGDNENFEHRESQIQQLLARGASRQAVDALSARLALPVFGEVGGQAIIAADDGTTISFTSHEGPAHDWWFLDSLPYAAPLFEWEQ